MKKYEFVDEYGTFRLESPENTSYLYFPIAGEQGIKGSITPELGGDIKLDQNHFLLQPVSAEELHNNKSTRNFWCRMQDGRVVSLTGASAEQMSRKFTDTQDECVLRAGIMWHEITRKLENVQLTSTITSFVPYGKSQVEIMSVAIKNDSNSAQMVTPIAAVPMYGRSADNIRDHRHVTSLLHRIVTTDYGVEVNPTLSFDERGHQKNDTTYYVYGITDRGESPEGFYPVVEEYIGEGGSFERPEAVIRNVAPGPAGMEIDGFEAMGGIRFEEVTLAPGESKKYIILLGMEQEKEGELPVQTRIRNVLSKYSSEEKVEVALASTKEYWKKKLNVSYRTADKNFDAFMYWVNFQPMLRRIYGCSFLPHHDYGKGGRGWRDLWQDCLALLIMNPDGVREMLLDNYGGVRMDGTNATIIGNKQGEFIADRNNITRVWMDHGFWPLLTTKLYIDQTGDIGILLKEQGYFKDKQVVRGTKTDFEFAEGSKTVQLDSQNREYKGSILEHILLQNLTCFYEVGEHNHMRLRGADWNDALDMASRRGESVAFSAAYAGNLSDLAELLKKLKEVKQLEYIEIAKEMEVLLTDSEELYDNVEEKVKLIKEYGESCQHVVSGEKSYIDIQKVIESLQHKSEWLKKHIRKSEWITDDEEGWFNSYYDNSGEAVERIKDNQVRMMLTGQVFSIMSGTATDEQVASIAKSADKYLYREEAGGYRLNTDFHELKMDLGRMFGFAYGQKENGAVFSHMTTMYANALYQRGFAKEGYKAIKTLYKQADNFEVSKIYPGIPEYFNDKGRGMYHYLTGAASWLMLTVITEMFGIKGKYGNLCLEPKLMKEQFDENQKASVKLTFGKKKWKVIYVNSENKDYGEYKIGTVFLDGNKLSDCKDGKVADYEQIRLMDTGMEHEIIAELI